jgi:hypothetical protein
MRRHQRGETTPTTRGRCGGTALLGWATVALGLSILGLSSTAASAQVRCPGDPEHPEGVAKVASVSKGGLYLFRPGNPDLEFDPVAPGTVLCSYDELRTSNESRARIEYFDRNEASGPSVVNIGPDTHVRIERYLWRDESVHTTLELLKGKIRAFLKHISQDSAFSVRTGTAVCGIRGSTVISSYEATLDETTHMVDHGLLECRRGDEIVPVTDQEMISILAGLVGQVQALDPRAWAEASAAVDAHDGWHPPSPFVQRESEATDLPDGCKSAVQVGVELETSIYKVCDPNAGTQYQPCSFAWCITAAQKDQLLRDKPSHTAQKQPSTCAPKCEADLGFKRLEFPDGRKLCGRCPDGTRFHRGKGCCV